MPRCYMIRERTKSPLKAMELPKSFKLPSSWMMTPNALRNLWVMISLMEVLLAAKLDLFTIGIFSLLKIEMILAEVNTLEFSYEELNFDFPHVPSDITMDDTPTHLKVKDLKITCGGGICWKKLKSIT